MMDLAAGSPSGGHSFGLHINRALTGTADGLRILHSFFD